jgi:deoxycytidylate deaminase
MGNIDHIVSLLEKEACKSDCHFKHAAILTYCGKIISIGHNYYRYGHYVVDKERNRKYINQNRKDDKECKYMTTIHAEIDCLRKVPSSFKSKTNMMKMYIVRIKNKQFHLSTPCKHCEKIITKNKVKFCFHS